MNDIDKLIKMANDIGNFFDAQPDRQEGIEGIADHIKKFWDPRMRIALLDFLEQNPEGKTPSIALSDIARQAISQHRAALTPAAR